ncbi:glycosyltransferase [Serpentinimonas barnesii]|uniref:glycosyltransferase n=1 Tax=Serpentinimonas barnesii TaxID=1458427 RepID=UPI000496BF59|nr:glycosyltransferase [Serpentinimonas barnesii]
MQHLLPQLQALRTGTGVYRHTTQPYYIVAPAYAERSAGVRLLHQLCSLLNRLGFEAYVQSPQTSGELWTPQLTPGIQLAHWKAGKVPVVVYPEVAARHALELGLAVRYLLYYPGVHGGPKAFDPDTLVFKLAADVLYPGGDNLELPTIDTALFQPPPAGTPRDRVLYYYNRYSGLLRDFGPDAVEISPKKPKSLSETAALYQRARVLYAYEYSTAAQEARLCGCPVVYLPNEERLPTLDRLIGFWGLAGLAWGDEPDQVLQAQRSVGDFPEQYAQSMAHWREDLIAFIEKTQQAATALPFEQAWPQTTLDKLPGVCNTAAEKAARADRLLWQRLHTQYDLWRQRSTLREIDADIYAGHLVAGRVEPLTVLIDQRGAPLDALADTLDSLAQCLGQPVQVQIVSDSSAPEGFAEASGIVWHQVAAGQPLQALPALALPTAWVLLLTSGTTLAPRALMEWGLAVAEFPQARLIYADEDLHQGDSKERYPHFKPDANVELLRCMNYLGPAVAMQGALWQQIGQPLPGAELYAAALALLARHGRPVLGHIDTVLVHGGRGMASAAEAQEFDLAQQVLQQQGLAERLQPLPRWGTWLVPHRLQGPAQVSLVVPTGLQTGYLRSLLLAAEKLNDLPLAEAILVCQPQHAEEVRLASADTLSAPVHIVLLPEGEYNHAAALNAGIARASGEFVLVCDDDTEPLHAGWLERLVAIAQQSDVGLVAPRLLSSKEAEPKVVGGPLLLGVQGLAASYCGEEGWLDEAGAYSRLQLTQDTSAVSGHCFVLRKAHWERVGGLREQRYPLFLGVLDLCLRLGALGLRHVWTPLSSLVHHGGKTLQVRRSEIHDQIRLADQELEERRQIIDDWAAELAQDRCYNRQLSLLRPFDIEADIVIDWNPRRHDRARALALPLHSGAGQYRVIEPLHALQDVGLVQSCVVMPMAGGAQRVLQPLELRRAQPDVLVLQHAVDDGQLGQVRHYKRAAPATLIVQMVDDLLGEVPDKHPNREFQSREGHRRMVQALRASDRLIVTTDTLLQHYRQYVPDVRLVPNSLDRPWFALDVKRAPGERLRIGWIGAGQHQGDLELIAPIVAEFAAEVDWVFMGMSIDAIKPHLKEFHSFVSIADYPAKMATLNLDIAIAPLQDNLFNRCKSNLRLLEYGAMGWPVVCSDVFPYRTDDAPVLRCNTPEAWRAALRRLIDDAALRAQLGHQLQQWVQEKYALQGLTQRWFEAIFAPSQPTSPP